MKNIGIGLLMLSMLCVSGCAPSLSGRVYSREEARQVQTVQEGTVIAVREVLIEGTRTGIGAVAGGVMGYVLGETVGSGSGKDIARAAGTIGGAGAGAVIEEKATQRPALEITVMLDNGQTIAIVQEVDEQFSPGDTVRVMRGTGGTARVSHLR